MRHDFALLFVYAAAQLALAGCMPSSGEPAAGFADPAVARVYLPLSATTLLVDTHRGAAVLVRPDIAVTVAHNANLLDAAKVIGRSANYDLLFFRTDQTGSPANVAEPRLGEHVLAYGEGADGKLRIAHGEVTSLEARVNPICAGCKMQSAFTFAGDAGKGFSGGPVVDAADGHLLGIVFGYLEGETRTIYAYDMQRVALELVDVEKASQARAP